MIILFIADIVGQPGRDCVRKLLPELAGEKKPDIIIANAENVAGGKGLTGPLALELFDSGAQVLTLGNHAFDRKEVDSIIGDPRIVRPANYPPMVAGRGCTVITTTTGKKLAVISLMGRVYMPHTDCPFRKASEVLETMAKENPDINIVFVDFHAEITSEKQAMGWYLDGRVSAVIGTHTHIPTADERILPGGTAYLTDAGMTGPRDGVIGMDKDIIIKKYITGVRQHYSMAKGTAVMQGCVITVDETTGKATNIERFSLVEQ
ncbi:MAG: metallophosphoesterase [Elusimicrobia bacterium RIFOXYA2_FULL_50_26]|nr:MAG: metallophosphoesterase [Elusimicrobia bacterium RIFOXYA2_FULL_50_26]OGS25021.1 MAG: metallophosphoesterase [Elusimicrobia bacterium RIFOXYB2_FULL_50_12]